MKSKDAEVLVDKH